MHQEFFEQHWKDANGNPAGGVSSGRGFVISWQNGPLGRGEERKEPNGAFVEDILVAVFKRIGFYQDAPFACVENAAAMKHIEAAIAELNNRTARREVQQVEGTHDGN